MYIVITVISRGIVIEQLLYPGVPLGHTDHHISQTWWGAYLNPTVIVNLRRRRITSFGSNNNHTISATGAILCGRLGIFEYLNIIDIIDRNHGDGRNTRTGQEPRRIKLAHIFLWNTIHHK